MLTLLRLGLLAVLVAATAVFGADQPIVATGFAALLAALSAGVLVTRPRAAIPASLLVAMGCFAVAVVCALSQNVSVAARVEALVLVAAGGVFLALRALSLNTMDAKKTVGAVTFTLLLVSLMGFIDYVIAPDEIFGYAKVYHDRRLTATFLSANTAATFFGMTCILTISAVLKLVRQHGASLRDRNDVARLVERLGTQGAVPLVGLVLSVTCLMLTGSRAGSTLTMAASVGLLLWISGRSALGRRRLSGLTVLVLLFAALGALSGDMLADRAQGLKVDGTGRGVLWPASLEAWQAAPVFGHGLGQFKDALQPTITPETAGVLSQQGAAHNVIIQWMVETGLVGTLLATIGLLLLMRHIFAGLSRRRRLHTTLKAVIVCTAFVFAHAMVDYALQIPAFLWWFAAILGTAAGIADGRTVRTET